MKRFGATQWDTHEGYFITMESKIPIDLDRMTTAFEETINRHGSFRTIPLGRREGQTFTDHLCLGQHSQRLYRRPQ